MACRDEPRADRSGSGALLALLVAACGSPDAPPGSGQAWPAADGLFHRDRRFLGADGAYSVDLGGDRVLWLFGDSFIARDADAVRDRSTMINNAVAVQTGRDPSRAFLRFYWRQGDDGEPRAFLPAPAGQPDLWYWPTHGIRLGDRLLLFYEQLRRDGAPAPDNFRGDGWTAVLVDNPDDDPPAWRLAEVRRPDDQRGVQLGEAVVRDGDYLLVYGTAGDTHAVVLARFAVVDARAGDLSRPAYWCGDFDAGCAPDELVELGMPEFSVHHDPVRNDWLLVGTAGYGATTLSWRGAPAPWGPWSDVGDVFRPEESSRLGAFVYAGKAHPALWAPGGALVATYVPSSFVDQPWQLEDRFYYPRFVRLVRR